MIPAASANKNGSFFWPKATKQKVLIPKLLSINNNISYTYLILNV